MFEAGFELRNGCEKTHVRNRSKWWKQSQKQSQNVSIIFHACKKLPSLFPSKRPGFLDGNNVGSFLHSPACKKLPTLFPSQRSEIIVGRMWVFNVLRGWPLQVAFDLSSEARHGDLDGCRNITQYFRRKKRTGSSAQLSYEQSAELWLPVTCKGVVMPGWCHAAVG